MMTRSSDISERAVGAGRQSWAMEHARTPEVRTRPSVGVKRANFIPGKRIRPKQLPVMTSQWPTRRSADCDLGAGLETPARRQEPPRRRAIRQDRRDLVESGQPFSRALEPLTIIVRDGLVGFIAIAVIFAMFKIGSGAALTRGGRRDGANGVCGRRV